MGNEKTLLRKYEDDLNVSGMGFIILGAWDVVKVIMQILTGPEEGFDLQIESEEDKAIAIGVVAAVLVAVLLISFLIFQIHVYVGRNAMRAAKGQNYKKGYYKGAVILLVLLALSMTTYIDDVKDIENIDTTIASMLVDITTIYTLVTMIISTRKLKQLKRI